MQYPLPPLPPKDLKLQAGLNHEMSTIELTWKSKKYLLPNIINFSNLDKSFSYCIKKMYA